MRVSTDNLSFLMQVYGIFKVSISKSSSTILMLMENLTRNFDGPLIFDLKGSTHQRSSSISLYSNFASMPRNKIYKDIDFFRLKKTIGISQRVIESIEIDSGLLEKFEIMDYSLLVIIETISEKNQGVLKFKNAIKFQDYIIRIGIIDFLQGYTSRKRIEKTINTLRLDDTNSFSCVPPDIYRRRFLDMIRDAFYKIDDALYISMNSL